MQQLKVWRNRLCKFYDHPAAIVPFLKKQLYYRWVSDRYIPQYQSVRFLSYDETVKELLTQNRSIVRFGDEVFDMLLGIGLYFNNWRQQYDAALATRLKEVLASADDRLLVCFNPELILKTKAEMDAQGIGWQHQFWTNSRVYLKDYIHVDRVYGSALSFHERYNPALPYEEIIEHMRHKHLIIVASNTGRFLGQQFGLTTSYVEAPASDAWSQYDTLLGTVLREAKEYDKESVLVLASIGPAAKVMVFDLTKTGYTVWDTGQFFDLAIHRLLGVS
jgi:Glycosyltransferase GT-D fold